MKKASSRSSCGRGGCREVFCGGRDEGRYLNCFSSLFFSASTIYSIYEHKKHRVTRASNLFVKKMMPLLNNNNNNKDGYDLTPLLVTTTRNSYNEEVVSKKKSSFLFLALLLLMLLACFGIASSSFPIFAAGGDENDFGASSSSLASLGEENKRSTKERALLRNEFNNGEETATKAKTTQQQQKRLKFSSNVFNFYRKNVAPKLGDFGSFARDMMHDKPPVVTNENEESDVDYDDIRSSGENVRGSW